LEEKNKKRERREFGEVSSLGNVATVAEKTDRQGGGRKVTCGVCSMAQGIPKEEGEEEGVHNQCTADSNRTQDREEGASKTRERKGRTQVQFKGYKGTYQRKNFLGAA